MANTKVTSNVIADNAVGITQLNVSDGSSGQFLKTDGSGTLSFATVSTTTALDDIATGDAASTLATSAGNITIDAQGSDTDIIFKGTDGSTDTTFLTLDGSNAGRATFNSDVNIGGIDRFNLSGDAIELTIGTTTDTDNSGGGISFVHNSSSLNSYLLGQKQSLSVATYSSTPILFLTNNTERMRINSSGHLLVGTTSDAALDGVSPGICVGSTSSTTSGISFSNANHEWLIYNASDGKLRFYDSTSNDEVAFIDTSRRFTFGGNFAHTTYGHVAVFSENSVPNGVVVMEDSDVSSGIGNTILNLFFRDQDPATSATYIDFRDGGGRVGTISHADDGGSVNYNQTSDYRLKENVNYTWNALTLLNQLKPAKFNYIKKPDKTIQGFLAHEVSDLVPGSVVGEKDQMEPIGTVKDSDGNILMEDVFEHFCKTDEGQTWTKTGTEVFYQQLDQSKLIPLLTKAIQEQQTIIEDLKTRIETLEG